jgi:hypothetical protein
MYGGRVATRDVTVTVTVCRGCCCGSSVKHPDVDHDGILTVLTHAMESSQCGVVRVVNCLDECERSDVVAVRLRRLTGTEIIWLGPLNDPLDVAVLGDWLRRGAVGDLPASLAPLVFTKRPPRPPIAVRHERGEEESLVCPALRPALERAQAAQELDGPPPPGAVAAHP